VSTTHSKQDAPLPHPHPRCAAVPSPSPHSHRHRAIATPALSPRHHPHHTCTVAAPSPSPSPCHHHCNCCAIAVAVCLRIVIVVVVGVVAVVVVTPSCRGRCGREGRTIVSSLWWSRWSRRRVIIVAVAGSCHRVVVSLLWQSRWSRHRVVIVVVAGVTPSCYCCHGRGGCAIVLSSLSRLHHLAVISAIIVVGPRVGEGKGNNLCGVKILGSKVPYLVIVIRSDCSEFGLCSSCPSQVQVQVASLVPFFLLAK
jgi:hypothetical protein